MSFKKFMLIALAVISSCSALPLYEAQQEAAPQILVQRAQPAAVQVDAIQKVPVYKIAEHHEIPVQYTFEYSVNDPHTHDVKSHKESRQGDVVKGYYTLLEADGRRRTVHYTADKHNGFNAVVTYDGKQQHPITHNHHSTQQNYAVPVQQKYVQPAQKYVQAFGVSAVQSYEVPVQKYEAPVQKYEIPTQKNEVPIQTYGVPIQKNVAPVQTYGVPIEQQKVLVSTVSQNQNGGQYQNQGNDGLAHSYIYSSLPTDSSQIHGANHHTTSQSSHSISTHITHIIPPHHHHH